MRQLMARGQGHTNAEKDRTDDQVDRSLLRCSYSYCSLAILNSHLMATEAAAVSCQGRRNSDDGGSSAKSVRPLPR